MATFAAGKLALGICDRSGLTYRLKDLVPQIKAGRDTGLKVSRSMLDQDQPQLMLGELPVDDPEALRGPRPDLNLKVARNIVWNWAPVGDHNLLAFLYGFSTQSSTEATGEVGSVTVSV